MFSPAGIIIYKGKSPPGSEQGCPDNISAFAPTLKMMICIAIGYVITKRGGFPPEYGKGVSILSLVSAPLLFGH